MKLVVDADGTIHFSVDFYVVTVHGKDLHGVNGGVLHAAFLLVGEHVNAEDQG